MSKTKNDWRKFFRFNQEDNMTRCLLCKEKRKYFSGFQFHNLKRHFIGTHQGEAKALGVKIIQRKKKRNQASSESESAEAWADDTVDTPVVTESKTVELGVIKITSDELKLSMYQNEAGEWKVVTQSDGQTKVGKDKLPFNQLLSAKMENLLHYPTSLKYLFYTVGDQHVASVQCQHEESIAIKIHKDSFNPVEDRTFNVTTKCFQCGPAACTSSNGHDNTTQCLAIEFAEPSLMVKPEHNTYGESNSDEDFLEEVEVPTKKRKRVDLPSSSAACAKIFKPEKLTVWDEFDRLLVNCAKKEIKKSIEKVQHSCRHKDRAAKHLALLTESPYVGINICKAIADLGLKLRRDIEKARKTLETEIELSFTRNIQNDLDSDSNYAFESDD